MTTSSATKSTKSECQLCEGHFCTKNGLMVKHGYKRPGDGYLVGECGGSHHAPFPATDALVPYLAMLQKMASDNFAWLNALRAGVVTSAVCQDEAALFASYSAPRSERARLAATTRDLFVGVSCPSDLAKAFKRMTWAAEQKDGWLRSDIARVERRLALAATLSAKAA